MEHEPIIGVVGGMGPQAGLDLVRKIMANTRAATDQEHLPVLLFSFPNRLGNRAAYLGTKTGENPGNAIADLLLQMERLGVTVAGVASSAAHIPEIFQLIQARLEEASSRLRVVHLVEETVRYVQEETTGVKRIGVLSTLTIYRYRLFASYLEAAGYETILPDENVQENIVNRTIFDPTYGLKAQSTPVSLIARQSLLNAIGHLQSRGADAIVLGSAELPLAITESDIDAMVMLDPTNILARALIRESYPDRLKG